MRFTLEVHDTTHLRVTTHSYGGTAIMDDESFAQEIVDDAIGEHWWGLISMIAHSPKKRLVLDISVVDE